MNTESIPWGVHFDLPSEQYHALPGASASILKCFWGVGITPAHARVRLEEKDEVSDALVRGMLIHHGILEPEKPLPKIEIEPETYPAPSGHAHVTSGKIACGSPLPWHNGATFCKRWKEAKKNEGITILKADEYLAIDGAVKAVAEHQTSREYFRSGRPEVSLVMQDAITGLPVRCRIDWLPDGPFLVDIKSCRSADPDLFSKQAYDLGYHIQFALYLDLWSALAGNSDPRPRMKIVAVETAPPYAVCCFYCDESFIDHGRRAYRRLLNMYARCIAEGQWSAYPDGEAALCVPHYVKDRE